MIFDKIDVEIWHVVVAIVLFLVVVYALVKFTKWYVFTKILIYAGVFAISILLGDVFYMALFDSSTVLQESADWFQDSVKTVIVIVQNATVGWCIHNFFLKGWNSKG